MLFLLGVLLAGGAGAFTGLLTASNTGGAPKCTPEIFGQSLPPTLNTLGVFCSGVALGLILCAGLWLIVGGGKTQYAPGLATDDPGWHCPSRRFPHRHRPGQH